MIVAVCVEMLWFRDLLMADNQRGRLPRLQKLRGGEVRRESRGSISIDRLSSFEAASHVFDVVVPSCAEIFTLLRLSKTARRRSLLQRYVDNRRNLLY